MASSITTDELHAYYAIDREIFSRLVLTCLRDPAQSILVMAIWLWIEDIGYPNIISKLLSSPDHVLDNVAGEAVACLSCLESGTNPRRKGMPLTSNILGQEISIEMFLQNKFSTINGIKNFLNTVCAQIFTDILQRILSPSPQVDISQPLKVPGFPHPLFGGVDITVRDNEFPIEDLWGWDPNDVSSEDDKTMFLTFSRGFPVTKEEVTEFFTGSYGDDSVVSVYMQETCSLSEEQPLFAKMVLVDVNMVDRILNGRRIAKFQINGKHIWARKYERRDHKT